MIEGLVSLEAFHDEMSKIAGEAEGSDANPLLAPGAAAVGGAGLLALPSTRGNLTGYKRVYHGTGDEIARSVREQGLQASMGGSGAAEVSGSNQFIQGSKGKVHVSPMKSVGKFFAKFTAEGKGQRPEVLKADLPMAMFDRFDVDPDMTGLPMPESMGKHIAAKSSESVPSRYIHGGKGFGRLALAGERLRALPGYAAKHPGRLLAGAGAAGIGAAGVGWGGKELASRVAAMREGQ